MKCEGCGVKRTAIDDNDWINEQNRCRQCALIPCSTCGEFWEPDMIERDGECSYCKRDRAIGTLNSTAGFVTADEYMGYVSREQERY